MDHRIMFVGTYTTNSRSDGIYSLVWNRDFTRVISRSTQSHCRNPSWLVKHPRVNVLYACDDSPDTGGVFTYEYNRVDGSLTFLSHLDVPLAKGTCHAVLSKKGRYLLLSNYYSGNLFVCSVGEDGRLGEIVASVQHEGRSAVKDHQDSAHTHFILPDQSGRFLTVCELGTDRLMLYCFDEATGSLSPNPAQPSLSLDPGQGPRHAVFHPAQKWMYVVAELGCRVYAYEYNEENGSLRPLQSISTLREGFVGNATAGEILITADGAHLLVTNRWYDSIAVFDVDPIKGLLSNRREFSCLGGEPRHIALSADEKHIVICNQDTRNVVICGFDARTGTILDEQSEVFVWKPAFAIIATEE